MQNMYTVPLSLHSLKSEMTIIEYAASALSEVI